MAELVDAHDSKLLHLIFLTLIHLTFKWFEDSNTTQTQNF